MRKIKILFDLQKNFLSFRLTEQTEESGVVSKCRASCRRVGRHRRNVGRRRNVERRRNVGRRRSGGRRVEESGVTVEMSGVTVEVSGVVEVAGVTIEVAGVVEISKRRRSGGRRQGCSSPNKPITKNVASALAQSLPLSSTSRHSQTKVFRPSCRTQASV